METCDISLLMTHGHVHRVSLLPCPRARLLYRIVSLHPPGYRVTTAVLSDTIKEGILYF